MGYIIWGGVVTAVVVVEWLVVVVGVGFKAAVGAMQGREGKGRRCMA